MAEDVMVDLFHNMLIMCMILAMPPLAAALIVGLLIGLLQAITSIQEQTLTFVPKVGAIVAVYIIGGGWMLQKLIAYTAEIFGGLSVFSHL